MSPSIKGSDLKTKTVRLIHNSIVISFRKSNNYYINSENNLVLKSLDNGRPESWSESGNHLSAPALSYSNNDYKSHYRPDSGSGVPAIRCTCSPFDAWNLFKQFLNENSMTVWNPYLISCLTQLEFLGFLLPSSLLIGGTDFCLEVIRSSWSRRVLKAPKGFEIEFIGDISFLETSVVNQTQFTPLSEALCKCVNELNLRQIRATFEVIVKRLRIEFPNMEIPDKNILKNSLKTLVQNKKLFYDKQNDCFIGYQNNYKIDNCLEDFESLSLKNQQLLTCEEAFTRLHGKSTHYGSEESSTSKKSWGGQVDIPGHYYRKRDSLVSTGNSSTFTHKTNTYSDNNRQTQTQTQTNSSLRRSSSLRLESNKMNNSCNDSRNSTFKRSRSFKLNRKKHELFEPQESSTSESTSDSCKCKVDSNRKQSVLSKFLRFGTSSANNCKSKSLPSKSSHFSAQFPEINSAVIPYNQIIATKSTATQTVKCGPEDYATVIIKQASRHALAKSGSHKTNTDYEHRNSRCRCSGRESSNGKQLKANKSLNKCRNENKLETTPNGAVTGVCPITTISTISSPINDCLLCDCNPEINKINSNNNNRHELTNNNNNYWSKPNHQFFRQSNGSNKYDYNLRQSEGLAHNYVHQRSTTSPLSYIRSATFQEHREGEETLGDRVKGYQTAKSVSSPQTTRLNNSMSLIERPKDNRKTQLFNTPLDSHKGSQNRFTQNLRNLSSIQNQSPNEKSDNFNDINNSNNNICVDSEVNVKIEIGSTNTTKLDENNDQTLDDSVTQSHQNSTKIVSSTKIHSSNAFTRVGTDPQLESSNKHPVLTSATTVTTTMTLPNVYNNNNKINGNTNGYNNNTDWVQSPTDAANVLKSLKLCNEDNNRSNIANKQNNLLSEIKINSIPHLSPIRQKVAKAKAEFFNSTGPQTPTPVVTNLLIEK